MEVPTFLWCPRRAAPVQLRHKLVIGGLVGFGSMSLFALGDLWFRERHVGHPASFLLLSLALWFGLSRVAFQLFTLKSICRAPELPAPPGLRVAVFITAAPSEPLSMFGKTLSAAVAIRYPHKTYLLDGTGDPAFRALAERCGAIWLDVARVEGAKAGKINAALAQTDEDLVLVLDPDHVPLPEFLDRVLGHFQDETVGFVQVSQAYYNQRRSAVARAAAEQTYGFYGPVQMGLYGLGAALAIGANCTFRREALASIGGHAVGLAEDLLTSIRLHAKGWRSIYVPEVVSRGLVPEDLGAYFTQQLKWASGAVDMLLSEYPRLFFSLSWKQRIVYFGVGTYYGTGVATAAYLVLPYLAVAQGVAPARVAVGEIVATGLPVLLVAIALQLIGQRWFCDPSERGLHWRGMLLKLLAWPVYAYGAVSACFDVLVRYRPTPKRPLPNQQLGWLWPHLAVLALFTAAAGVAALERYRSATVERLWHDAQLFWVMLAFAALAAIAAGLACIWAVSSELAEEGEPWRHVPAALACEEAE